MTTNMAFVVTHVTLWGAIAKSFVTWPGGYKSLLDSTELNMKLSMLINVKMPTIVGILTFISMINTTYGSLKARKSIIF